MTTEQTSAEGTATRIKGSVNDYIDRLMEGHEKLVRQLDTVRGRNIRMTDKFLETVIGSQREALTLSKTIASQPTAYGKNMEAFMQSLTNAQERTMDLAKTVYKEQTEATAEARELVEPLLASGKNLGKPFEKIAEMWTSAAK